MDYNEEDWLQLSGIQRYTFCKREWALTVLENQWEENIHTIEGDLLHERAHDAGLREKRGDTLIVRGMSVHSRSLGVSGQCDVVEFHRDADGVPLDWEEGLWQPTPVEYKKGRPKTHDADRLQLCCEAMCLEEMLLCPTIRTGYLYYGQTARREEVALNRDLRDTVEQCFSEMHQMVKRQHTPKVKPKKGCNACALKDVCLPFLMNRKSAAAYIAQRLREPEGDGPCEN